jgi:superoxide dismutase, Cu-Zn family
MSIRKFFLVLLFIISLPAFATEVVVKMYSAAVNGKGEYIGTITAKDTDFGLLLTPKLVDLPPGIHGFHLHTNPSCNDYAKAAGGHWDPNKTNKHLGPYNENGHLGDLPVLYVDKDGDSSIPVLAPRLTVSELKGHALIIHAGGDNYSDKPEPLGGGGMRIACGVVK